MSRYTPILLWCVILLALVAAQLRLCGEASRVIPNAMLLKNPDGLGISVSHYLELDGLTVSAVIMGNGYASAGSASVFADLKYTDSRYGGMVGLRMLNGAFFPDRENAAAVISDRLASELFFSLDILGAKLEIDGVTYSVCGVYKKETSMAARLSENGIEDVYIPLAAYSDKTAQIKAMYCRTEDGWFPASVLNRAVLELGVPLKATVLTDYGEANLLAAQSGKLLLFLLGIQVAGIAIAVFCGQFSVLCRDIYASSRDVGAASCWQSKKIVRRSALCLLCSMTAVLVLWLVSFDPHVPSGWLQWGISVNRFAEHFILETQRLNASEYRFFDIYVRRVLIWLYTLDILWFISGFMLAVRVIRSYTKGTSI